MVGLRFSCEEIILERLEPGDVLVVESVSTKVKRISYQALVRSLHSATQVQRSRKAAQAQGQGLVILAKNQAQELMYLGRQTHLCCGTCLTMDGS